MSIPRLGRVSMSGATTAQSLTNRTNTIAQLDIVDDTDGGPAGNKIATGSTGSNNITINYSGLYLVNCAYRFSNPTTSDWKVCIVWVSVDNQATFDYMCASTGENNSNSWMGGCNYYELTAGAKVSMHVYQAQFTGGNTTGNASTPFTTFLEVTMIDRL